ncbi:hypothetical protein J2I47_07910 [Fibrella sp. HMF5335]|uniref:Uncharacterized protein n=1 Tax=Fibrella rubiginis TaxID=2817060 RepID=A0A939GHA5_9BACT|nr:hypothetical protein [Fibrella rubiginis]MBO0936467.1 hypothetical protein [Fibrella rubiginis]
MLFFGYLDQRLVGQHSIPFELQGRFEFFDALLGGGGLGGAGLAIRGCRGGYCQSKLPSLRNQTKPVERPWMP